jgi:hypothetical protein
LTSQKQYFSDGTKIGIRDDRGMDRIISFNDFCSRLGVGGWVRLHPNDYSDVETLTDEFVHFNLEATDNAVDRLYAVVPILRPGKRLAGGEEQLPVVDMGRHRLAVCVEVIQRLPIDRVTADQFRHSLPSVRSAGDLRKALMSRYAPMLPDVSEHDLLARGTAVSRFRFVGSSV